MGNLTPSSDNEGRLVALIVDRVWRAIPTRMLVVRLSKGTKAEIRRIVHAEV